MARGPLQRASAVAPSPQGGRAGQGLGWGRGAAARPRAARRAGPPLSFVCDSPRPGRRPPFCELAAAGRAGGHFFSRAPASPPLPHRGTDGAAPGSPAATRPRPSTVRRAPAPGGSARSQGGGGAPRAHRRAAPRGSSGGTRRLYPGARPALSHPSLISLPPPHSAVPTRLSAAAPRPRAHGATRLPPSIPAPRTPHPRARPAPPHAPHPHGVGKPGAEKNDGVSAAPYILCDGAGPRRRVTAPGGPRATPRPAARHAALR